MSVLLNALVDLQQFAQGITFDYDGTEDGSGKFWLLVAGPLGGGATWIGYYNYYRNVNKSHAFEKETLIDAKPIFGRDNKIDEVRGTKRTEISGNNRNNHRIRVTRLP